MNNDRFPANILVSNQAWAELKRRSVMEQGTASSIIEYVLRSFLLDGETIEISLRRKKDEMEETEIFQHRVVYLDRDVWQKLVEKSKMEKFSKSALVEYLLRRYLGLSTK